MRIKEKLIVGVMVGSMIFSVFATGLIIWASSSDGSVSGNNLNDLAGLEADQPDALPAPEVFTTADDVTELDIVDLVEGEGVEVDDVTDILEVHYHGTFADTGEVFDSSFERGVTAEFPLNQVIEGWTEGLIGLKEGGSRRLVIPSEQAYGESGNGTIPGGSDLVFHVDLISVTDADAPLETEEQ